MFEEHANKLLVIDIAITINVSLEPKGHELSIDVAHFEVEFVKMTTPHVQTLLFPQLIVHPPLFASPQPNLDVSIVSWKPPSRNYFNADLQSSQTHSPLCRTL